MSSIDYYNKNSQSFYDRTIHIDMSKLYQKFLSLLTKNARILDAGCGVGRDARYFKNLGYDIRAFDASSEMVKLSSALVEIDTLHLNFQDVAFKEEFDAIWANASLLHVSYQELEEVLKRLHASLKSSGILFASFKYGESMREESSRTFYDMNEPLMRKYLNGLFEEIEIIKHADERSMYPSPAKAWLHVFCRKLG